MATQLTNCYYRQTDERKRARELFILYLFAQFIRPSVQSFFYLRATAPTTSSSRNEIYVLLGNGKRIFKYRTD